MEWCKEFTVSSRLVFTSVTVSRAVYALCWFDAAATFPALAHSEGYNLAVLGELTAAFFLGASIFQVPAGIFSAHLGAKRATLTGLAVIGFSSLTSTLSPTVPFQVATRFVTGFGAAFFFAPALVVVSNLFGEHRSGLTVGIYNAAFTLGGGFALFAFTPLAAYAGWRMPYLFTGILTLAALTQSIVVFKGPSSENTPVYSNTKTALSSRTVWSIALGILGMAAAYYVVSQFIVEYSEDSLNLTPALAGAVSSLALFGGLAGGPAGGWISDKFGDRRKFTLVPVIAAAFAVALFSVRNVHAAWAASLLLGFADSAAYTNAYVIPTEIPNIGRRYAPIAIGLINSVGILGGSVASGVFAGLVTSFGFSFSWIILGLSVLLPAPFIYAAGRTSTRPEGS